jgi:hypothetical protein
MPRRVVPHLLCAAHVLVGAEAANRLLSTYFPKYRRASKNSQRPSMKCQ